MSKECYECRLCARVSSDCTSLLAAYLDTNFLTYQKAVLYCTSVLLSTDDIYPQNICNECVKELLASIHFKKKCENALNLLQQHGEEAATKKTLPPKAVKRKYRKRIKTEPTVKNNKMVKSASANGDRTKNKAKQNAAKKDMILDEFGKICLKYESEPGDEENKSVLKTLPVEFLNVETGNIPTVKLEQAEVTFHVEEIPDSVNHCDDENTDELLSLSDSMNRTLFLNQTEITQDYNRTSSTPKEKKISRIQVINDKLIIKKIPLDKIRHLAEENFRERKDGSFECLLCGRVMTDPSRRFIHYRIHLGPTHCDSCNKEYHTPQKFLVHMKRVHSGRVHICDLCGKSYKCATHLETHMLSHTGEKPHKCPHCGRGFVSKSNLLPHIKTHLGMRDFICSVCGIGKTTSSELRFHMRIHQGTKPFKCDSCDYSAVSDYAVRRHALRHKPIKPFQCPIDGCDTMFTTAYDAKRHTDVHKVTSYKCEYCSKGYDRRDSLRRHLMTEHELKKPFQKKKISVLNQRIEDRIEVFRTIKTMMKGRKELEDKSFIEKLFKK